MKQRPPRYPYKEERTVKHFAIGVIPPGFMVGLSTTAGRLARVLAVALLACASLGHSQVIEKDGFPEKSGGVWGETVGTPAVQEECGPFMLPGKFEEGCLENKSRFRSGPDWNRREGFFSFGNARRFRLSAFPSSRSSGASPPQMPCSVFLEQLATGTIKCYVWDPG